MVGDDPCQCEQNRRTQMMVDLPTYNYMSAKRIPDANHPSQLGKSKHEQIIPVSLSASPVVDET